MGFPALHRLLGRRAGPLTNDMLDVAIVGGVRETDDLDWKSELPEAKDPSQSDVVKDVAAMANSGGMIVVGIKETDKAATGRTGVGELDQTSAMESPRSSELQDGLRCQHGKRPSGVTEATGVH